MNGSPFWGFFLACSLLACASSVSLNFQVLNWCYLPDMGRQVLVGLQRQINIFQGVLNCWWLSFASRVRLLSRLAAWLAKLKIWIFLEGKCWIASNAIPPLFDALESMVNSLKISNSASSTPLILQLLYARYSPPPFLSKNNEHQKYQQL